MRGIAIVTNGTTYPMSFTLGGLYLIESTRLLELYRARGDWKETAREARDANLFQTRMPSSHKRMLGEVRKRLQRLTEQEQNLFMEGSLMERKALLWVAICRTYPFIGEFAREMLREAVLRGAPTLERSDVALFFGRKAEVRPEVERLSPSTGKKLQGVLWKILREAELVTDTGEIQCPLLTRELVQTIYGEAPEELTLFPADDKELRRWLS